MIIFLRRTTMCSSLLNGVFIALISGGLLLTLASLVSPEWEKYDVRDAGSIKTALLWDLNCTSVENCKKRFEGLPDWKKAAIGCMALAIIGEAVALGWAILLCCMCCCFRCCLTPPLPILAGISTVLIIIALILFGAKSEKEVQFEVVDSTYGYSMWLGVISVFVMAAATAVGVLMAKTASVTPI